MPILTIEHFRELARERNHELISVSNETVPRAGNLTIHCNTCGQTFTASAHSYQNARRTGCPSCRTITARNQIPYPRPQRSEEERAEARRASRARQNARRALLSSRYDHIGNRNDLRNYLISENNVYSAFILEKLSSPPPQRDENPAGGTEVHHIIPRHAGGPDSQWNLIELTRQDHVRAHELRYEAYNETGDASFLRSVRENPSINPDRARTRRANNERGAQQRRAERTGIHAEGASAAGGRASSARPSQQRRLSHQNQMAPEVRAALYEGSVWYHAPTNTSLEVPPNQVLTLSELKDTFIRALPEGDADRERLATTANNVNVTSNIRKVIMGQRQTAYGWRLCRTLGSTASS